ncbi:hypothetical protein EMIHUDRAFT_238504 [Emiliania huxleyi CCMP1516]|uniref:Amino acid transporter transmembrane domain-containing protein n=2 Tax=Emiliania huxleyi TaxID=2903 RepID=A0A0D3JLS2_EMIH1|nr:hypothetical protein EMIHUDRAFT_238504 [Emiliania huxleyi CCMP1516]EOD24457.1 hypothetical protein EMIHUDRAFT_238504 [Emiliania huxleyi CCMP1516]|eukprot:XP_005776886.1 hypothetical protein EMIHUDRAFT_238504 [Emiliania huxleyi CCMP1516]
MRRTPNRDASPPGEHLPLVHGSSAKPAVARESLWYHSSFLIMAEAMGMGVLGIPHATAQIGWGLTACVAFGLVSTYSSLLLGRKGALSHPSESDGGRQSILPFFLLACAESARTFAPLLLVALLLLPPLQLRTLHQVVGLSFAGAFQEPSRSLPGAPVGGRRHSVWLPSGAASLDSFGAVSAFVFAYQCHSVLLEIMREMREPRSFPAAARAAYGVMGLVYTCTCVLAYGAFGSEVAGFLPESMPPGHAKRLVGLAALSSAPGTPPSLSRPDAEVSGVLLLSIVLATAVPFFSDLQSLLGSLAGAPMMFGFPALFYLRACRAHGLALSWFDAAACHFLLYLLTPTLVVLGTLSSMRSIAHSWEVALAADAAAQAQPAYLSSE